MAIETAPNSISNQSEARRTGLLDVKVKLSVDNIVAGEQFTVFVEVTNPFDRRVWIRNVSVSLPDAIKVPIKVQPTRTGNEDNSKRLPQINLDDPSVQLLREKQIKLYNLKREHERLQERLLESGVQEQDSAELKAMEKEIEVETTGLEVEQAIFYSLLQKTIIQLGKHSTLETIDIHSDDGAFISLQDRSFIRDMRIGKRYNASQIDEQTSIELESSLPLGAALQPGNTTVHTIKLRPVSKLAFRPTEFRLQFNILYSFEKRLTDQNAAVHEDSDTYSNTTATSVLIKAPMPSIFLGAALGGIIGALVREFIAYGTSAFSFERLPTVLISVIVSVSLAIVSILFTTNNSATQIPIVVEDIYGGAVLGFLVGYSGLSFFQQISGTKLPNT